MSHGDWEGYFVLYEWGDRNGTDGTRRESADPCPECFALVTDEHYAEHEAWHHKQHKALGALTEAVHAVARTVQLAFRRQRYGGAE